MTENSSKKFRGLKFAPVPTFAPKVVDDDDRRAAEQDEEDDEKLRNRGILQKGFFLVAQSSKEPICMILFKWVLVLSGAVLLGTVIFTLGSAIGNTIKAKLESNDSISKS